MSKSMNIPRLTLVVAIIFIFTSFITLSYGANTFVPPYIVNLYNASYYTSVTNYSVTQNLSGTCGTGFVLQNVSGGVFQCIAQSSGSGTVTSIIFRNGFNQTTITNSGIVDLNYSAVQQRVNDSCSSGSSIRVINLDGSVVCESDSTGSGTVTSVATGFGLYGGIITSSGTIFANMSELVSNFGNWSADKSNYATLSYTQSYVSTIGNFTLQQLGIYQNITNLQNSNTSLWLQNNGQYINISTLQILTSAIINNFTGFTTSNATSNARIDNLNTTKASIGNINCSTFGSNFALQNLSMSASGISGDCIGITGSGGGVTSITAGDGLLGDTITTTGTISLNDTFTLNQRYLPYENKFRYFKSTDFESSGAYASGGIWTPSAISSGNFQPAAGSDSTHVGLNAVAAQGGTAGSGAYWGTQLTTMIILSSNYYTSAVFNLTCHNTTANVSEVRFGFMDSYTSAAVVDGVYFNLSQNTTTTHNVTPIARQNNQETRGTTFEIPCNNWYEARIYIVNNSYAQMTILNNSDIVNTQNLSYNIPASTSARATGHGITGFMRTGARYTTLNHVIVDYMELGINQTLVR